MNQSNKSILVDADILSHFMASGNILKFHKIFSNKKVVLTIVANEIRRHPKFRQYIDTMITQNLISEIPMPNNPEILREYNELTRSNKGSGESACMAVARFSNDVIASNNWKDIKVYCDLHNIEYLSTLDFLYQAYKSQIMELHECDFMIYNLLSMKPPSKIPFRTLEEYCSKSNLTFPVEFENVF